MTAQKKLSGATPEQRHWDKRYQKYRLVAGSISAAWIALFIAPAVAIFSVQMQLLAGANAAASIEVEENLLKGFWIAVGACLLILAGGVGVFFLVNRRLTAARSALGKRPESTVLKRAALPLDVTIERVTDDLFLFRVGVHYVFVVEHRINKRLFGPPFCSFKVTERDNKIFLDAAFDDDQISGLSDARIVQKITNCISRALESRTGYFTDLEYSI